MGGRLFTDKLVFWWLESLGVWSLDSATPATSAYPVHASESPDRPVRTDIRKQSEASLILITNLR
jgi:hypothetical protein